MIIVLDSILCLCGDINDSFVMIAFPAAGNLRHLIVEACIARNILDTSAYFWPGYVQARSNHIPRSIPGQAPGWSSLMKGSPLTPPLVNVLVATPAPRYMLLPSYIFSFLFSPIHKPKEEQGK